MKLLFSSLFFPIWLRSPSFGIKPSLTNPSGKEEGGAPSSGRLPWAIATRRMLIDHDDPGHGPISDSGSYMNLTRRI
ncbi:hypothetical protein MUK42_34440 [Musa troglodytarum]|uniref:Secreted protein n=1 Tax=Musa troglodytarum TaxID=320322 RepID=A0A9E7IJ37_9LILI|nr:hypothetical protein MUK42_34440 [Musa troglodytarum]